MKLLSCILKRLCRQKCVLRSEQVRDEVHRHVAKLMAWSMKFAAEGKFPTVGFHDEEFDRKSVRHRLAGAELAQGWRRRGVLFPCVA